MSQLKSLAKDTAIYGLSNILIRLLNFFIATAYLTRIFHDDTDGSYGIYTLMYAYMALLLVLLTYGMETAFFRFGTKLENRNKSFSTAFVSLLVSTVTVVAAFVFFSDPLADVLARKEDGVYIIFFSLIIGFDVLSVLPYARLRLEQRPVRFAFYKLLNVIVFIVTLLFFLEVCPYLIAHGYEWPTKIYNPEHKLQYVFWGNLTASIVTFILFIPLLLKTRLRFNHVVWKKMIEYALPLVVVGVTGIFVLLAGQYLLPVWLPGDETENLIQEGIFGASVKIATLLNMFTQVFKFASEPFFFKHKEKGGERKMYGTVAQLYTIAASLGFLVILLYLDLLQYIVDRNFRQGLHIIPIVLLANIFFGVYLNFSIWYKLTDNTRIGAMISTGGMLVVLGANYFLIPRLGIMGAAWSALIAYSFLSLVAYVIGQKYYAIPFKPLRLLIYIGTAVGVYLLSEQMDDFFSWGIVVKMFIHTIWILVYLGILFVIERKGLLLEVRKG